MLDFNTPGTIVITCKDRSAPFLAKEIRDLGLEPLETERTSVKLSGSLSLCLWLNLRLRTASHVLFELKHFSAGHPMDVYKEVKSYPWEKLMDADGYFSVISNVRHESVDNPLFLNLKVKDAIADRFREKMGRRPDSGSELRGLVVQLFWKNEDAFLYLNTSGESLAKHGYRKMPGNAPMMEDLAAATLMAADWRGEGPFVNPMCGAGTLAIEAAMIATKRYPGLYRHHFALQYLKGFDQSLLQKELENLKKEIDDTQAPEIIASDRSREALRAADKNAKTAGVEHLIRFKACDFADTPLPEEENGLIFFNPEYGQRLGEMSQLEVTYKRIGDFLKQAGEGYTGFIFTGNLDLAKKIGLKTSSKIPFYNGKLDCRLLKFELYRGSRRPAKEADEPGMV
jgi:putative N6-adenine-specific DNA methylase